MEERRWFSLVNLNLQGRLILALAGGTLFATLPVGAYVIYLLRTVYTRLVPMIPLPDGVSHLHKSILMTGYLVLGTYVIVVAVFTLFVMWISNRIAGPIYRLSRELDRMAETGDVEALDVREEDFFHDLVTSLNRLLRAAEIPEETLSSRGSEGGGAEEPRS